MHRRDLALRFPCPQPGKQLAGDRLYCASCDREVIELERLTEAEVRSLKKRAHGGERICVRYRVDEEGLIELRRSRPMRPLRAAAAAAGLAALIAAGGASADTSVPRTATTASGANGAATGAAPARAPKKKDSSKPTPQAAPPRPAKIYDMIDGGI